MKVLITAPARQDPRIFDEYRKGIARLEIPPGCSVETFFVVNNCPALNDHMIDVDRWITFDTNEEYVKTGNDHLWTLSNMERMGELRDITIRYAMENGFDYWFSVDTDIVLQPETLRILLKADKDIVSEIFWTMAPNGHYWCNAWMEDQAHGMPEEWHKPGLYQCGMTGACTLVKRRVFEAGVRYKRIPNIRTALKGEDRHFCVRAACAGFDLWVDTHAPARHLYTEKEYKKYMAERK